MSVTKKDIIDYVIETPGNSNPAVLSSLIDQYEGGGTGAAEWGKITGNIEDQNDLKTKLDEKATYGTGDAECAVYKIQAQAYPDKVQIQASTVNLKTGSQSSGGYYVDLPQATSTNPGLMSTNDKIAVDTISNKVDSVITTGAGTARIFNEEDGGGAKFEASNGTASFAGVNKDTNGGIGAQLYDIDVSTNEGAKLDVTKSGIYYTKGAESSQPATSRDISDNEIITKKNASKVSVSSTGTATDEVQYITIDGVEKKLAGGTFTDTNQKVKADNKTFGADAVVELKAGDNVTISADDTSGTESVTITAKNIGIKAKDNTTSAETTFTDNDVVELVQGNNVTIDVNSTNKKITINSTGGGSGEPSAYIKSASVSTDNKKLTLTNKDGSTPATVEFTPNNQRLSFVSSGGSPVEFDDNIVVELNKGTNITFDGTGGSDTRLTINANNTSISAKNNATGDPIKFDLNETVEFVQGNGIEISVDQPNKKITIESTGGGEPAKYIKEAGVSGNTLTLKDKDDNATTFNNTNQTISVGTTTFDVDDEIKFVAGANITLAPSQTDKTITISSSGGGGGSVDSYSLASGGTGSENKVVLKKNGTGQDTVTVNNVAHATSADSATKATQDEDGNNIKSTYATASSVSALATTVGSSTSGLVKDVSDLKTAVGDSTSGLVKTVSDLSTSVDGKVSDVQINGTTIVNSGVANITYSDDLSHDSDNAAKITAIRAFVNSSIAANAANQVAANAAGDAFTTHAALVAGPYYYNGAAYTPQNKDYAIVSVDETHDNKQTRYTYTGTAWQFAYVVGTTFTASQQAAIDSGVTSTKVATYDGYATGKADVSNTYTKVQVDTLVDAKQDAITTTAKLSSGLVNYTTAQSSALESGITASKVSTYDGYATTIGNKANSSDVYTKTQMDTSLAGKQDKLSETSKLSTNYISFSTAQSGAIDSGITAAKVSTYDGYATTIDGKQNVITTTNQLSADLVKDGTTNHVFTATDDTKLAGISSGANKVTASTTNGNILIDGTETTVYTLPSTIKAITVSATAGVSDGTNTYKYDDSTLSGKITTAESNITSLQTSVTDITSGTTTVGKATTAEKLGSSNLGTATKGIYLESGVAKEMTYSLSKDVPSDAVFTDTHYTSMNYIANDGTSTSGSAATNDSLYLNHIEEKTDSTKSVKSAIKIKGENGIKASSSSGSDLIIDYAPIVATIGDPAETATQTLINILESKPGTGIENNAAAQVKFCNYSDVNLGKNSRAHFSDGSTLHFANASATISTARDVLTVNEWTTQDEQRMVIQADGTIKILNTDRSKYVTIDYEGISVNGMKANLVGNFYCYIGGSGTTATLQNGKTCGDIVKAAKAGLAPILSCYPRYVSNDESNLEDNEVNADWSLVAYLTSYDEANYALTFTSFKSTTYYMISFSGSSATTGTITRKTLTVT